MNKALYHTIGTSAATKSKKNFVPYFRYLMTLLNVMEDQEKIADALVKYAEAIKDGIDRFMVWQMPELIQCYLTAIECADEQLDFNMIEKAREKYYPAWMFGDNRIGESLIMNEIRHFISKDIFEENPQMRRVLDDTVKGWLRQLEEYGEFHNSGYPNLIGTRPVEDIEAFRRFIFLLTDKDRKLPESVTFICKQRYLAKGRLGMSPDTLYELKRLYLFLSQTGHIDTEEALDNLFGINEIIATHPDTNKYDIEAAKIENEYSLSLTDVER